MKRLIFLCLFFLNLNSQGQVIPRNKVDVKIKPIISADTTNNYFKYEYKIYSLPTSEQSIWMFAILLSRTEDTLKIYEITWPPLPRWDGVCIGPLVDLPNSAWVNWGSWDSTAFIPPGDSASGFSFKTYIFPPKKTLLPDINDFYVEGYAPIPSFPEGEAPGMIPGYDDLTPYGPGKVYKTVGPGPLPPGEWNFDSTMYFVSDSGFYHLIDRVNKCFEQNWLKERAKDHLTRMYERGLRHYQNNRVEQARKVLSQVIDYLERERGNLVFDEAFYVLYYRTKFVSEHLALPVKK